MMRAWIAAASALMAAACGGQPDSLSVEAARYRAPLVDGGAGVAYFSIMSTTADRITNVSSPGSEAVEIHETMTDGGMAGMQRRDSVDLPAGKPVIFDPAGLHLMVIRPQPLAPGATFPIQIELESGRVETFSFVQTPAAS